MGDWHEVKTIISKGHPCFGCLHGWKTVSYKSEADGKCYIKKDSCDETCLRLKEYYDQIGLLESL